jgi:carboxymethylenebutenolidase
MRTELSKGEMPTSAVKPKEFSDLGVLFDSHIAKEFADLDVNATMETMVSEPYVHCVPSMTGGFGAQGVRRFLQ